MMEALANSIQRTVRNIFSFFSFVHQLHPPCLHQCKQIESKCKLEIFPTGDD